MIITSDHFRDYVGVLAPVSDRKFAGDSRGFIANLAAANDIIDLFDPLGMNQKDFIRIVCARLVRHCLDKCIVACSCRCDDFTVGWA